MSYKPAPVGYIAAWDQSNRDADRARELVEMALDPQLSRAVGPDRLIEAAKIYATLSTRVSR